MLKAILVFAIFAAIGLAIPFLFPIFNLVDLISNLPTTLQNGVTWLQQLPIQVLASIGGAVASVSVVIGKLFSNLRQAKQQTQQAQQMVSATQTYASDQIQTLSNTIDMQQATITNQTQQIQSLQQQLAIKTDDTLLQQQLSVKEQELENMRASYDNLFAKFEEYKQKVQIVYK